MTHPLNFQVTAGRHASSTSLFVTHAFDSNAVTMQLDDEGDQIRILVQDATAGEFYVEAMYPKEQFLNWLLSPSTDPATNPATNQEVQE